MDLSEETGLTPVAPLILRTARLVLRPLQDADWPELARIGGQPGVARMMWPLQASWSEPRLRQQLADMSPATKAAGLVTQGPTRPHGQPFRHRPGEVPLQRRKACTKALGLA